MGQAIWKGHITFGMVSIPVALLSAESPDELSFSLLDRRDHAPVGYRKINKLSGREIPARDIVKGYEFEKGEFVLVTPEDLKRANAEATKAIEILDFVDPAEVPTMLYERPYWLAPIPKGEKAYRLLAETIHETKKVGVALVVISHRQHLGVLSEHDGVLVLDSLRFANELRQPADVDIDAKALARIKLSAREKQLARRLVDDMTTKFDHAAYHDAYRDDLRKFLEAKARSKTGHVKGKATPKQPSSGKVIDLMEILERSVRDTGRRRVQRHRKGA